MCVTFLYPKTDDATFDMGYYTSTHMPMVAKALGADEQGWGAMSVSSDNHIAMGWVRFESMDVYDAFMTGPARPEISADVANYTNQWPEIIVGEIASGG
jgi:uncharacterized protein (TIGR02118 family)